MALPARNHRISRRDWLLAGLAIPLFRARANEQLSISFDGDNLHVVAPGLHFLAGKPLSRLKDADTVTFLSQLTLFSDPFVTIVNELEEHFGTPTGGSPIVVFVTNAIAVKAASVLTATASPRGSGSRRSYWRDVARRRS